MNKSLRAALISTFSILISLSPWISSSAQASQRATATGVTSSASSATFIAYATTSASGGNPNGAALVLSNTTAAQYFYVRNTGTVAISMVSLGITYTAIPAKTAFYRCEAGVTFSALNTCASGVRTSILTSGTLALNLAPGSWYAFELDPKKLTTPTVSISVSSSQIRSPIFSNA